MFGGHQIPHLLAKFLIDAHIQVGIVAGGIQRGHHREQRLVAVQLAALRIPLGEARRAEKYDKKECGGKTAQSATFGFCAHSSSLARLHNLWVTLRCRPPKNPTACGVEGSMTRWLDC